MKNRQLTIKNKQSGFTLLEIFVTLSILVILATMLAPGFANFFRTNQQIADVNEFISSLNIARSEALERGARITICKSTNASDCVAGGDWSQGWIIFEDTDNNATRAAGEELIRVYQALAANKTLAGKVGNVSVYISYAATGFTELIDGNIQTGEIVLCDNRGFAESRIIEINAAGRARTAVPGDPGITAAAC